MLKNNVLPLIEANIAKKIKSFRKQKKLRQKDLAAVIGVSFQQLQKYETGENKISAGKLYLLTKVLNVKIDRFFEDISDDYLVEVDKIHQTAVSFIQKYDNRALMEALRRIECAHTLENGKLVDEWRQIADEIERVQLSQFMKQ